MTKMQGGMKRCKETEREQSYRTQMRKQVWIIGKEGTKQLMRAQIRKQ